MRFMSMQYVSSRMALIALFALASCTTEVQVGEQNAGDGQGINGGGDGGVGDGGNVESPEVGNTIALRADQQPWWSDPSAGDSASSSSSGGGAAIDPNTLYVEIGNFPASCGDTSNPWAACDRWRVSIALPPELQALGVISLADPRLISTFSMRGPNNGGGADDCSGGGGSFIEGTIEITSIDASQVGVRLTDTAAFDFDADGEYTVPRCP